MPRPRGGEQVSGRFLPGVLGAEIGSLLNAAPGNEIASGKFDSPESSAALAVNAFGFFLRRAFDLPLLPGCEEETWPARWLFLEAGLRFPWRGGRHPVLDCGVYTPSALIGIESKRFEPFRSRRSSSLSDAYWRPVWGERMGGYQRIRDGLRDGSGRFARLDAAQLFEHALALRSDVPRRGGGALRLILFYVYAELEVWPARGAAVDERAMVRHRCRRKPVPALRNMGLGVRSRSLCSKHPLLSNRLVGKGARPDFARLREAMFSLRYLFPVSVHRWRRAWRLAITMSWSSSAGSCCESL